MRVKYLYGPLGLIRAKLLANEANAYGQHCDIVCITEADKQFNRDRCVLSYLSIVFTMSDVCCDVNSLVCIVNSRFPAPEQLIE